MATAKAAAASTVRHRIRPGRRAKPHNPRTEMVHVRVSLEVKKKAQEAFDAMGFPMSAALRYLLNFVANRKALPFRIEVPNAKTRAAVEEARHEQLPSFNSVSDLMADLNAED